PGEYDERPNETNSRIVNLKLIAFDGFNMDIFFAISLSLTFVLSFASMAIFPLSFAIRRLFLQINVLFPATFGPINEVIVPFSIFTETSSTTVFWLYFLNTRFISTMIYSPLTKDI